MKKVYLVVLLACISFFYGYSQEDYRNQYDVLNFKWLSPAAFQMQESAFLNLDNSLFYGRIEYNLPLYEIKIGNIKLPITLNYSSNGLKVEQEASDVGLGWYINTGGSISRIIKGGVMDNVYSSLYKIDGTTFFKVGWNKDYLGSDQVKYDYKYNCLDQSPDVFVLSALGYSDRFLFMLENNYSENEYMSLTGSNNHYRAELGEDIYSIIPQLDTSFRYKYVFNDFNKFIVNLPNGIQISFIPIEAVSTFTLSAHNFSENQSYTNWGIEKITDLNSNRSLEFIYDEFKHYHKAVNMSIIGGYDDNGIQSRIHTYRRRLKSINWPGGNIDFVYDTERNDIEYIDGSGSRVKDCKLDRIKIYNNANLVKQYEFNYNYFKKQNAESYKDYRLKLVSIKEVSPDEQKLPSYQFDYYSNVNIDFPSTDSEERDYWGFFNNNNSTTLFPKLYFYKSLVPIFNSSHQFVNAYLPYIISGKDYIELTNNSANRDANEQACKMGMLKKVVLPTGGCSEFDYELNKFSNTIKPGGGLRIKSQKIYDGKSTRELNYNYDYGGKCQGFISRFPSFAYFAPCFPRTIESLDQSELTKLTSVCENSIYEPVIQNGSYVGYHVVEEIEVGNGKIQYCFHSPSSLFDSFTVSATKLDPTRTSDMYYSFPDILPSIGLIDEINYFDENSHLIKSSIITYSENIRREISIKEQVFNQQIYPYVTYTSEYKLKDMFIGKSVTKNIEYDAAGRMLCAYNKYKYDTNNNLSSFTTPNSSDFVEEIEQGIYVSQTSNCEKVYYNADFEDIKTLLPYSSSDYTSVLDRLNSTHQIVPILKRKSIVNTLNDEKIKDLSDEYYHYKVENNKVLLDALQTRELSANNTGISTEYKFYSFDLYGRPILYTKGNNKLYDVVKWLPNYDLPLYYGQSTNNSGWLYTSFERDEENWGTFLIQYEGAKTGNFYSDFCSTKPFSFDALPKGNYSISFWYKGSCNAYLNGSQLLGSLSSSDWKFFSTKCTQCSPSSISFSGNISLDDVSIFPEISHFTTFVHKPLIGVLVQTDANGASTVYSYDSFNRLKSISDQHGNVLKYYDYNFGLSNGAIDNITPPFSGTTEKNFELSYTRGNYIIAYGDNQEIRSSEVFTKGYLAGRVNITDEKTGVSVNADFNVSVQATDSESSVAEEVASAISQYLSDREYFYNVTIGFEGSRVVVNRVNSSIETDVSHFRMTVLSIAETPSFQYVGIDRFPTLSVQ